MAGLVQADTLVLKDGRTLEGKVSETGDKIGIITKDGVQMFARDEVDHVVPDVLSSANPAERAAFLNVKHAALHQDTPSAALALWDQYVAAHQKGPLLPLAQDEMAALRQAQADGLTLWAGKLLKPEERDKARHEAHELIDAAVTLCHAGKYAEAQRKLVQADGLWPDHPTVHFYQGVALRELKRPVEAAQKFLLVCNLLPEHAPSLNNAAGLCVLSTDYLSGAKFMARALRRDPENETLNNNAWEILAKLEADKEGVVVRLDFYKVAKEDLKVMFDACLAQQSRHLAAEGKVRWGSQWVDQSKRDEYMAAQKETDRQVKEAEAQLRALAPHLKEASERLANLQQQRDAALQAGPGGGGTAYLLLPQIQQATDDCNRFQQQMAAIARDIATLKKKRPAPSWTGKLTMLDIESPAAKITGGETIADETFRKAFTSGRTVLEAADGTPLGHINADAYDPLSLWDPLGKFGSPYSKQSIFDPTSPLGQPISDTSPWNPKAAHPPRIMLDGKQVFYLTANPALLPNINVPTLVKLLKGEQ